MHEANAEISAMFATVGGQVASYLERVGRTQAENRDLRAELHRTRGFLDAAGAMVVVLDAEGRVQLANARACAAIGLEEHEMLDRDWFALSVPRAGRAAARVAFEQLLSGEADTLHHRLPSAEGQRRAVTWHGSTLDDGRRRPAARARRGRGAARRDRRRRLSFCDAARGSRVVSV